LRSAIPFRNALVDALEVRVAADVGDRRAGLALGVDYAITCSCCDPGPRGEPCGACDACRLRAKGFAEAGVADPLVERFRAR